MVTRELGESMFGAVGMLDCGVKEPDGGFRDCMLFGFESSSTYMC